MLSGGNTRSIQNGTLKIKGISTKLIKIKIGAGRRGLALGTPSSDLGLSGL